VRDTAAQPGPEAAGQASAEKAKRLRFGWYFYGWASHTFETIVITVFMSRYLPAVATNAVGANGRLHVLGIPIAPGSLFAYTISLCAILLVIVMPVTGAIADRVGHKREMLLSFGYVGAFACIAMFFVQGTNWLLGALLLVIAYLSYSCANVIYNSILPDISDADARDRVSSVGWGIGYVGSGILLALNFVLSFVVSDQAMVARISLCSAGVWWALFALVPIRALRGLPQAERAPHRDSAFTAGFKELGKTLKHLRLYPLTLLFLVAFLIYNDGISTVVTLSADYGQNALKLGETTLLSAILIVQFAAFGGALLLGRLAYRFGAKKVVGYSLVVWILVVVLAYFLQVGSALQFYLLALLLSIVMGGSQALSRSLFTSMIPGGKEAEYFSLYEISNSSTSALGPLIFGITLQTTGNYRTAIFSLIIFFVVGLALLIPLNVRRAVAAAGNQLPASLGGENRESAPVA
jgi:MFS transporter, UMF1 family